MIKTKQNGKKVWVTFTLSEQENIESAVICGTWNDWAEEPMKQKKNGEFYITKVLPAEKKYEFGYKLNGSDWCTDGDCVKTLSPYGSENAVLEL